MRLYNFSYYGLLQDIEYHSSCATIGPCYLSIPIYTSLVIHNPKLPIQPLPSLPHPALATTSLQSLFSVSVSLFLLHR